MACGQAYDSRVDSESNGLLGDTCNSCCVDQKVCVGINCLPIHFLFVYCLMITLLNIKVGCTLQNRRLCSEYNIFAAVSTTLKLYSDLLLQSQCSQREI